MGYDDLMKAQAEQICKAADKWLGGGSAVAGGIAGISPPAPERPCLLMLGAALDQIEKLASMTTDLANRIGSGGPDLSGLAKAAEQGMPADLRSTALAIERALNRVEANVARALQSL